VLAALSATSATGLQTIRYNAPPPNFAIPTPHGTEYLTDLRGRVVVLNYWATWCEPCKDEMKYFQRAERTFGNRVRIVTISDDLHDVAASYFRLWNIDFPVVEDESDVIKRIYSITKIPVTLVLDPEGRVSYVSVGGLNWDELRDAIQTAEASPGGSGASSPSTPAPRVLQ
jgi:thiol-disulfide isomerase/thioredoxin